MKSSIKIVISGAAGQIGYALLFRIAAGEMFGKDQPVELSLLEIEPSLEKLSGTCMELDDGAFPLLKNISITSNANIAMKNADWILLVGAAPRKAGMVRNDLLKINAKIFAIQGKAINDHAKRTAKILVVGNPCNTNCLITLWNAPEISKNNFFAMTMLDELRAKSQLAKKAQISVNSIKNMIIWGNHSATQFPDFYHATINNKTVQEIINNETWLQQDFIKNVQQRGAAVIKTRGASSAASAANAIIMTVQNLTNETDINNSFSVAKYTYGEYDFAKSLIVSLPCRIVNNKIQVIQDLQHNEYARTKLKLTNNELLQERAMAKQILCI